MVGTSVRVVRGTAVDSVPYNMAHHQLTAQLSQAPTYLTYSLVDFDTRVPDSEHLLVDISLATLVDVLHSTG